MQNLDKRGDFNMENKFFQKFYEYIDYVVMGLSLYYYPLILTPVLGIICPLIFTYIYVFGPLSKICRCEYMLIFSVILSILCLIRMVVYIILRKKTLKYSIMMTALAAGIIPLSLFGLLLNYG